jgi:hypothetical protein
MSSAVLVLAGAGLLALAAAATLAAIVVGIRRADCRHLASKPDSRSSAFARRILLGVRYPSQNGHGEDR